MEEIVKCGNEHLDLPQEATKKEQGKCITEPLFKFDHTYDPEKKQVTLKFIEKENSNPNVDIGYKVQASINAALGAKGKAYTHTAFMQVINAQFVNEDDSSQKANATLEALIEMRPLDIIEGQLCSRLIVLQDQYNEYIRRAAMQGQPLEVRERYTNMAIKLMRMHNETLESLNKYRRKGEQKVTVQHVNISGGQAVVTGELNHGGGGDNQKEKGGLHVR